MLKHDNRVRNDATNRRQDTNNTLITDRASRGDPSERNNRASLQMSDNRGADWASLRNDEELRHVDERSKATRHENHDPAVHRHLGPDWEGIDEWDNVEQHESRDWRLVEEELHRVHLQLFAVTSDPNGVKRRRENAGECEEDTQAGGGLDIGVVGWEGVVVRHHADTGASWDQSVDGVAWEGRAIENVVHQCDGWREQDAGDLVKGDGGEGEGEVWEDDVHRHGDGEWDDLFDGDAAGDEHGEAWAGEGEEGEPGDEEVEAGKGELGELEGWVGEDGLVCEDLREYVSMVKLAMDSCSSILTIPMVASVLTTIQMIAARTVPFSGSCTLAGSELFSSSCLSTSSPISISSDGLTLTKLEEGLLSLSFFSS